MLGIHVAKTSKIMEKKKSSRSMLDALKEEVKLYGLSAAQIFTHGPRNIKKIKMDHDGIKTFVMENKIELVVHSSYMTVGIWKLAEKSKKDSNVDNRRINHLTDQLQACDDLGVKYLVVHLPNKPREEVAKCLTILKPQLIKYKCKMCLEVEPFKPSEKSHETPQKLNRLCAKIAAVLNRKHWKLCIDTAHIWGSGIEVGSALVMDKWIDDLAPWVRNQIAILHLNGSYAKCGSHKDKHAIPFSEEDNIWGKNSDIENATLTNDFNKTGLFSMWKLAQRLNIPIIYEINRGSENDFMNLANAHKQWFV